jgi:hypothetical protein
MGLHSVLANATASAFTALGDIPAAVIIRRTTQGPFNPATGKYDPGTTTDYPVQGIMSGYNDFLIDGTLIKQGDRKLSIRQAEIPIAPATSDKVIFAGKNWTIITIQADAASVLWKLQVRG